MSEAYEATDPNFDGRVTVPVLWDKETKKIVNNCEDDICRMFNDAFNAVARNKDVDLFPKEIEAEHAKLADFIYDNVNNGVYKAGFATRQRPYEISCRKLFEALDELEKRLSKAATCSTSASSKRTGGSSARSFGSTSFITVTSNATSAASSIIRICKAT